MNKRFLDQKILKYREIILNLITKPKPSYKYLDYKRYFSFQVHSLFKL